MNKRLIFLIVAILLATFLMGSAPAEGINQNPPDPTTSKKAIIFNNETGESYELPVVTNWVRTLGEDRYEALYSVDIPEAILLGRAGAERWDYDSTRSAKVYVYVNYGCSYIGGTQYMSLNYVKGKWVQLDGAVSCTTLKVAARCYGDFYSGGFCNRYEYRNVYNPTSGAYYQKTPSWSGDLVAINEAGYYQSGITTAYLMRGGSTWNFSIYITNPCLW